MWKMKPSFLRKLLYGKVPYLAMPEEIKAELLIDQMVISFHEHSTEITLFAKGHEICSWYIDGTFSAEDTITLKDIKMSQELKII